MHFNNKISFSCTEVIQPIGKFYIGVIDSRDLVNISYADVRTIENERREVEKYLGIERPLSPGRVAELKEYVGTVDATFPTSIILAVSSNDTVFDSEKKIMTIRRDENVAKIIDGQHRIAGLRGYSGDNFQLNVTIFVDMDIEDQAMVFATINLKQTKVSKSLAYDLYEFSKTRSPQRTCHNIAKLLNYKEGSPFKSKIKILGVATGKPQESITQATFVDRLIQYISKKPMNDRDLLKRKKELDRATGKEVKRLIFRNLFIDDSDAKIARNLWNYFKAVEKKWPQAWPEAQRGNILNRTTGFGALMRFLRDVYLYFDKPDQVISTDDYYGAIDKITLVDDDFSPEKYKPGSSGEGDLYRDLVKLSGCSSP
jgi:DGQHR domain-containing protein